MISYSQVSLMFDIDRGQACKLMKKYQVNGQDFRHYNPGRPTKLRKQDEAKIKDIISDDRNITRNQLMEHQHSSELSKNWDIIKSSLYQEHC